MPSQPVDLLLKGATLVTMDAGRRVILNGALAVHGSRIWALGTAEEILPRVEPARVLDVSGMVAIPGLINTHGHWAMTLFRGLVDDQTLEEWLGTIWKVEAAFATAKNVRLGAQLAIAEMIHAGTTCAADMYWHYRSTTQAAREANFRIVNGPPFAEIPGFDEDRRMHREEAIRFLEEYAADPLVKTCVQAHAVYTVTPGLLETVRELAERYGALFITHASESRAEVAGALEKTGMTPIGILNRAGLLGSRTLLAHCVHLDDEEIALLAESGTSVAHCPSSNTKLASGIARVQAMLQAGVNVALGTDGAASNNDLDLLEEAQLAALLQKGVSGDPTALPAETAFAMLTTHGARAIGMQDRLGSLEPGKLADISLLDFNQAHLTPLYNIYSHLIYAANRADVCHVLINGKLVMENGCLLTLDEAEIKARARQVGEAVAAN